MEVLGVVPARGGSKGIPRKNLLQVAGRTLLDLAVRSGLEGRLVTRTICSTEDDELAETARAAGAEVPFIRPAELASDTAATWPVIRHALEWLAEYEGYRPEWVVVLQPTTPFRRGEHIDATVAAAAMRQASSAMTVREVDYPVHWMFWRRDDGTLERILPEGEAISRRQDAPSAWRPNGLVYAARPSLILGGGKVPAEDTVSVPMSFEESINIDSPWHHRLAMLLANDGKGR